MFGNVGHDAFAVFRETIREMDKVATGQVVLTNRKSRSNHEHQGLSAKISQSPDSAAEACNQVATLRPRSTEVAFGLDA